MNRTIKNKLYRPAWIGFAAIQVFVLFGCGDANYSNSGAYATSAARGYSSQPTYTIVLAQYKQTDSTMLAQNLMRRAKALLKTDDIWLLNDNSSLYVNYGHFSSETGKIEKEFKQVKKIYYDQIQAGPYQFCFIREIPGSDPIAPYEWNLLNSDCFATLEIGCYYNVPENNYYNRKEDAIQAVKDLRQAGEIAFYIHGDFESRIYIGCIPKKHIMNLYSSSQNPNPIQALQDALAPLQKRNPYRYENGGIIYLVIYDENKNRIRTPKPSIPRDIEEIRRNLTF
jgi:hypothetical protein